MSEGQDLDRNQEATPYKLEKAREQGSVPKSVDVVSVSVMAAAIIAFLSVGPAMAQHLLKFNKAILSNGFSLSHSGEGVIWILVEVLGVALQLIAPFLFFVVLGGIVGNVVQTGFVWSLEAVKPSAERINPVNGFKKIFSIRVIYEAFRALLKAFVLGWIGWEILSDFLMRHATSGVWSRGGLFGDFFETMYGALIKLTLGLLLVALLDWLYVNYEFGKKMRMSFREIRDEHKNREGDPRIRAKLKELRLKMLARSQALAKTGQSDLLIVNPTHLAVALEYKHGEMDAPLVLAKGAGKVAARMREIAAQKGIPVVQNVFLARELYRTAEVGTAAPPHLYATLAKIVVWTIAARKINQSMVAG